MLTVSFLEWSRNIFIWTWRRKALHLPELSADSGFKIDDHLIMKSSRLTKQSPLEFYVQVLLQKQHSKQRRIPADRLWNHNWQGHSKAAFLLSAFVGTVLLTEQYMKHWNSFCREALSHGGFQYLTGQSFKQHQSSIMSQLWAGGWSRESPRFLPTWVWPVNSWKK